MSGLSLAILVVADRLWQMSSRVQPARAAGQVVLTDRHVASTLVLQRIDGLEMDRLWELNGDVLMPDLQVILLAAPDVLRARLDQRGRLSRFERSADIEQAEVDLYRDAAAWLAERGIPVLSIETDGMSVDDITRRVLVAMGWDV